MSHKKVRKMVEEILWEKYLKIDFIWPTETEIKNWTLIYLSEIFFFHLSRFTVFYHKRRGILSEKWEEDAIINKRLKSGKLSAQIKRTNYSIRRNSYFSSLALLALPLSPFLPTARHPSSICQTAHSSGNNRETWEIFDLSIFNGVLLLIPIFSFFRSWWVIRTNLGFLAYCSWFYSNFRWNHFAHCNWDA